MSGSKIIVRNSNFYINSEADNTIIHGTSSLDVAIVGANPNVSKAYFRDSRESLNRIPSPVCFSYDGKKPQASSLDIQHGICATCPHNTWGSKITPSGVRVKACSDHKRLVVLLDKAHSKQLYLLQVSAASLKNLNAYQKMLQVKNIVPNDVVTRISIDKTVDYTRLDFAYFGYNSDLRQVTIDTLIGSDNVKSLIEGTTIEYDAEHFGFTSCEGYTEGGHTGYKK